MRHVRVDNPGGTRSPRRGPLLRDYTARSCALCIRLCPTAPASYPLGVRHGDGQTFGIRGPSLPETAPPAILRARREPPHGRGFALAAMVVLAFIAGLCISLMGSSALIARRQTYLFGERYRQEACRAVLPAVGTVLAAHGFPRASMEQLPWTLPCDRADDCPDQAYTLKKSGLSLRALPTTAGYLLFVWQGKNQICRGDRYVPVAW